MGNDKFPRQANRSAGLPSGDQFGYARRINKRSSAAHGLLFSGGSLSGGGRSARYQRRNQDIYYSRRRGAGNECTGNEYGRDNRRCLRGDIQRGNSEWKRQPWWRFG